MLHHEESSPPRLLRRRHVRCLPLTQCGSFQSQHARVLKFATLCGSLFHQLVAHWHEHSKLTRRCSPLHRQFLGMRGATTGLPQAKLTMLSMMASLHKRSHCAKCIQKEGEGISVPSATWSRQRHVGWLRWCTPPSCRSIRRALPFRSTATAWIPYKWWNILRATPSLFPSLAAGS